MSVMPETSYKKRGRPRKTDIVNNEGEKVDVFQLSDPGISPADEKSTRVAMFNRAAIRLKPLGDGTRLQILEALSKGELSVKDLCAITGLSQPSLTHHLTLFRIGEIIHSRREGRSMICGLTNRGRLLFDLVARILNDSAQ